MHLWHFLVLQSRFKVVGSWEWKGFWHYWKNMRSEMKVEFSKIGVFVDIKTGEKIWKEGWEMTLMSKSSLEYKAKEREVNNKRYDEDFFS